MAQSDDNPYGLVSFGHVSINPQHIVAVKVKLGSPTGRKEFEKIIIHTSDGKTVELPWNDKIAKELQLSTELDDYK
jgi:hypothetical protein